jgi:type II pantothenate kinase
MNTPPLFAVDIGGTLSKLAYIDDSPLSSTIDFQSLKGRVHLKIFTNNEIPSLISFMKSLNFNSPVLPMTGGGSYKYCSLFEEQLNTQVKKVDEIESLFRGFKTVMKEVPTPVFKFSFKTGPISVDPLPLPSMLCNIGSGVSICKIGDSIERLTGTCLGGGTALGLATMMLGVSSYDELLDLCKAGDANNVDLLYSDIDSNLEATLAVSLGKLALHSGENFSREDIAKSIVHMIAYNIGHVAFLAGKLQGIQQVCFAGNFLRGYEYIMDRISFAVNYWSGGEASALFMAHDGYFGAIGCLFDVGE